MAIYESHGTDKRRFAGENECQELLAWLNEPLSDAGRRRVRSLLNTVKEIESTWTVTRETTDTSSSITAVRSDAATKLYRALRKELRRYVYYPDLTVFHGWVNVHWLPVRGQKYGRRFGNQYTEMDAVLDICDVAAAGILRRVKKCDCGRWLFARFEHQRFCSVKCREKAFRSDPLEKAKRRDWARKNYWIHKNRNTK